MIKTKYVEGDELPYRIQIDNLRGAGISPAKAALAALSVGSKIPAGCRDRQEAAGHLFWNYQTSYEWRQLIHILSKDTFDPLEGGING